MPAHLAFFLAWFVESYLLGLTRVNVVACRGHDALGIVPDDLETFQFPTD